MSLLDTTFFIDLHRQDDGALSLWDAIKQGSVKGSYSAVTTFELWLGRLSQTESDFYNEVLESLEEVVLTSAASRRAASWLRGMAGPVAERLIRDAMIAASAIERGEKLCTRNRRDFSHFQDVELESY